MFMSLQIDVLEKSFAQVVPDAEAFAAKFYVNLFTDYPAAKPLFANTEMKAQEQKLLHSLMLVIENLHNPDVLDSTLRGLGSRHVQYGALPAHYPLVGNSLLKTFEQYLGADWTTETKQAWVDAYDAIATIMLEGANYKPEEVQLSSATPTVQANIEQTQGEVAASPDPATYATTESGLGNTEKGLLAIIAGGILTAIVVILLL
jgi:hemoglobin-like flavoprotein